MPSAIIIGLGRIGIGRGTGRKSDLPNHLAAMQAAGLRIVGLVDPDEVAHDFVTSEFPDLATQLAGDLSEIDQQDNEVVAICTPVETHTTVLAQALLRQPRTIILEKPVAPDFESTVSALAKSEPYDVDIRVNFHRRFDPRHSRWKKIAPDAPRLVTARFGKGLGNYASHIVDLLHDWYGPIVGVQALAAESPRGSDPNLSFRCRMSRGFDAILLGVDDVQYDQFEIDIYGKREKIEMRGGGALIRKCGTVDGLYHDGYSDLSEGEADVGAVGGFRELYAHIAKSLRDGQPLSGCSLADAAANVAVLDAALQSARKGGVVVEPRYSIPKGDR